MIKILFDYDNSYDYGFSIEAISKKVAKEVLRLEKVKYDISVNLSIVNKNTIKRLNKVERNINKETDVLSFPNIDFNKPSSFKEFIYKGEIDVSIVDLSTKTIFLGDIVICKDIMLKQAKEYDHSLKREFSFLFTHSMLHLLGYDHMKKTEEKVMFKKQDAVLNNLKIYR